MVTLLTHPSAPASGASEFHPRAGAGTSGDVKIACDAITSARPPARPDSHRLWTLLVRMKDV
jgi:hypothetical protein